jgi:hypothetical protein
MKFSTCISYFGVIKADEGEKFRNMIYNISIVHFLFNLLRIKGLCMFRALLTYPQEARHKQHLYCVRVMSVGCTMIDVLLH